MISVCLVFRLRFICVATRDSGEFGIRKCAHEDSGLGTGEPESANPCPSFQGVPERAGERIGLGHFPFLKRVVPTYQDKQ